MRGTYNSGEAEEALEKAQTQSNPEHGIKWALVGIGYALLDLAEAVADE